MSVTALLRQATKRLTNTSEATDADVRDAITAAEFQQFPVKVVAFSELDERLEDGYITEEEHAALTRAKERGVTYEKVERVVGGFVIGATISWLSIQAIEYVEQKVTEARR